MVQFLHFILKPSGLRNHQKVKLAKGFGIATYSLGLLAESFPIVVSAGRIDVSSHCLVKFALAFQFPGVDEGAAGYATDEVAAADDVVAACRGSSLLC